MNVLYRFIRLSRPRFWLYLAGPFWVGIAAGITNIQQLTNPWIYILLFYFLVPANVYLYGINDLYDRDTDALNTKKDTKEQRLQKKDILILHYLLVLIIMATLVLMLWSPTWQIRAILGLFLFFATAYSTPPLRFKAQPILDFSSNILYALPGIIGYMLVSQRPLSLLLIPVVFAWTSAMHLFSAIPDIQADTQAGLKTTAVVLGKNRSLVLCLLFWLFFAITPILVHFAVPWSFIFLIYPILTILTRIGAIKIERVYWWFPFINGGIGCIFFWYFILTRL